jgi:hypothetical protein
MTERREWLKLCDDTVEVSKLDCKRGKLRASTQTPSPLLLLDYQQDQLTLVTAAARTAKKLWLFYEDTIYCLPV